MSITLTALQQQRRDTAANWTSANPVLLLGEIGYVSDSTTGALKIGDGSTAWNSLPYIYGTQLSAYPLVNADIAAAAEIAVSKLANGTANQILTTDGADVSWTDNPTIAGNVTIEGDLTVNGTTTTIDTQTLVVEDKNIELGNVTTPSNVTADGGGITLLGSTNKTINWINSTDAWTFSEHVNIASGKEYRIAGTSVLTATTLGSGVVNSSLTSVGTIGTGTWQGDVIAAAYLPSGTTSATGIVQLEDSTSSTSTTTAATPNAVKSAYDLANAALPKAGGTMSGAIAMGTNKVTGVGDPTAAQDAATKNYVDSALAGISSDKISEGNTEAEVVDTGSDGHFKVTTEGIERIRVGPAGQIGIAGANYGTSGQVLTSGGAAGVVSWADAATGYPEKGATGTNRWAVVHSYTVDADYSIPSGSHVINAGPMSIDSGVTVTVAASSNWTIVS